MKHLLALIIIPISFNFVFAQNDTIALFHESANGRKSEFSGTYKSALSINLYQFVRGGLLFNYERMIASSGLAFSAGVGIGKFDPIGQFYVKEFIYYYRISDLFIEKTGSQMRPIYDFSIKYYFEKEMSGTYLCADFTSINNRINVDWYKSNNNVDYIYRKQSLNSLDYQSNEVKLLLGFVNNNRSKFYHDFNFGFGYRMIEYQKLTFRTTRASTNYENGLIEVDKVNKANQTPWFFIGWRIGKRF